MTSASTRRCPCLVAAPTIHRLHNPDCLPSQALIVGGSGARRRASRAAVYGGGGGRRRLRVLRRAAAPRLLAIRIPQCSLHGALRVLLVVTAPILCTKPCRMNRFSRGGLERRVTVSYLSAAARWQSGRPVLRAGFGFR